MTIEDLMKPRFEVISEYPGMILFMEQIITTGENGVAYLTEETKETMFDYPHLFKPLKWWEGRNEEDLPMYLKDPETFKVVKVKSHFNKIDSDWRNHKVHLFAPETEQPTTYSYGSFIPSTEQEYNEYLSNKHTI